MIRLLPPQSFREYDPKDRAFFNHCQLIPLLHQIVTNPDAKHAFPSWPRAQADFPVALQYWDSAYYYLTVMLGWADPGIGLLWYYNNDRNDFGDYRLQVLKQLWDSDDQLELLAAWIWRYRDQHIRSRRLALVFPSQESPAPAELQLASWWEAFSVKYPADAANLGPNPYYGDATLFTSGTLSLSSIGAATQQYLPPESPTARHVSCWTMATAGTLVYGQTLPELHGHSWHVHVFAKTIGYLGLFRRSRETGIWFTGKHTLHAAGNSHTVR